MTAFPSYAFTSTGGSQSRTYPDRLNDIINVKDFGAIGNGIADDTVAINACLSYTGSGTIYFPAGTYIVTSTIDLEPLLADEGNSRIIMGAGRDATFIKGHINTIDNPSILVSNPPFGNQQWGSGSAALSDFLQPSAIITGTWGTSSICQIRDMTIWNTHTGLWSYAAVIGPLQAQAIIQNVRFKGLNGLIVGESYGMSILNCIAESIYAQPTADQMVGTYFAVPPYLTMSTFAWNPPHNPVGTVNCYKGSVGLSPSNSTMKGCQVIGPFDVGYGLQAQAHNFRGNKVSRCGIGIWQGLGASGNMGPSQGSGLAGEDQIIGNVIDRCVLGFNVLGSGKDFIGNVISGTQGPADPATIQSMSWDNGTHVVTVTTTNDHNIASSQQLVLAVASDWLPAASVTTGIVSATIGGGLNPDQFSYAGPSVSPTSPGTGTWNYSIQHGIMMTTSGQQQCYANILSAVACIASIELGASIQYESVAMAMEGKYGWVWTTGSFFQSGWQFFNCGAAGSGNNPLIPAMRFQDLPAVSNNDLVNNSPPQLLAPCQQYWIVDATTAGSFGDFVGTVMPTTAVAGAGTTTLTFAAVPAGVAVGMGVYAKSISNMNTLSLSPQTKVAAPITGTTIDISPAVLVGQTVQIGDLIAIGGAAANTYEVRYNGTNWTRVA